MRALEIRWTLWALLPILSTSFSEAAAPTSCSEMDSTYEASVYAFSVNCDTVGGNPATYAYYSVGDTFASCIERCDLDDDCIAVNYQHFTGDCDLVAAFTQSQPSSDYDLAVKAYEIPEPITSTSLTTDVMSTTDSTTLQSTASTSETLSTSDYTSLPTTASSSDEVSTSAFTSIPETTSTSDVLSTADFTSLPSTESPSSTATTSDFMSTSSDYTSLFSTSSFASLLSTETFTSESTLTPTTSDSFVSSSMYLSGSTTMEDVTASSLTSSVLTFLTLSTSAAVIESSTITSVSFSGSSISESTSVPPTTSATETVTIIASNSLSTITTADSTISITNTVISSDDVVTKTSETTLLTDFATATTITTACTTRATLTDTVTSVTYVTVDSSLSVVTTCVPVTLLYSPCGCEHETYPTVDMVTVTSPCSIYSSYGKVTTTLTVPRACETLTSDGQPAVQYPSGWISSQTYSGHGSYYLAQPTAGSQTNSGPGSKEPSQAVPVLGPEAVSVKGKVSPGGAEATDGQPKATGEPSSEAGTEGNYHPEATAYQSIPAASQLTGSPQSSVHYEQVPVKVPNATETLLSWTTRHGNHQASAPASKTGSTDEIAQSNVPSGSGAKGSTPITVSGASRPHCVVWAIIGLVLMFY